MYTFWVWLLSLKMTFLRRIHVVTCTSSNPFLLIAENTSIGWTCHNLFIHSNAEEHLCCFQFGAVTNKLTFIYKSLHGQTFSFFFGENLGMKLLGHMVSICLTLYEIANLFSKVVALFYSPIPNVYELKLLHIFANTWHCWSFQVQPFQWVCSYLIEVSICFSLMTSDV